MTSVAASNISIEMRLLPSFTSCFGLLACGGGRISDHFQPYSFLHSKTHFSYRSRHLSTSRLRERRLVNRPWVISSCTYTRPVSVSPLAASQRLELHTSNEDSNDRNNRKNHIDTGDDQDFEEEEVTPDMLARWEKMYQEGQAGKEQAIMMADNNKIHVDDIDSSIINNMPTTSKIRVVTFDLDNTLWKTSGTINAANDVLASYLEKDNIKISKRIEVVMGELFQLNRLNYCPFALEQDQNKTISTSKIEELCKAPVLLTQLRIDAIKHVLVTENDFETEKAIEYANQAFEIWTEARHDAIIEHMAPNVIDTLQRIRTNLKQSQSSKQKVIIGAITDGNSNPERVQVLQPYFDFVINAESVGVSKPNKKVYLEAIRHVVTNYPQSLSDLLPSNGNGEEITLLDDEILEDIVGPYWCHIGDDFFKDIVPAKNLKMKSIWTIGLIQDKLLAQASKKKQEKDDKTTTMDMGEFMKQISSQTVVSLGIGADDYLATSLTGEFVDAVAEDFSHVADILSDWHNQGIKEQDFPPINADQQQLTNEAQNIDATNEIPVALVAKKDSIGRIDFETPRAFRIVRQQYRIDVPAPLKNRDEQTMKDVMSMAQMNKASGVFAFPSKDVNLLQEGKKVLMVQIGSTDLRFSREIFSNMTIEEVIGLSDENPVVLTLSMEDAVEQQSFDLF